MEESRGKKIDFHSKVDRISKLPEPILHHILCLVDQKTSIRTCVLSKSWHYLWCTRPQIEFDFVGKHTPLDDYAILNRTLKLYHDRNLRLDKFAVSSSDFYVASCLVTMWIPIIIENMRVKSFRLSFRLTALTPHQLELPSLIFESPHIQNLRLNGCMFQSWRDPVSRVDLKHLRIRILDLRNVYIPEELLDNVLSISCPFIEEVSLEYCKGFTTIKLLSYKPTNLTRFCFSGDKEENRHHVSIEIGNGIQALESIELNRCLLSVSQNEPLLSGSFSCYNLTRLYLNDVNVPEEILDSIFSNCTFIEDVSLLFCEGFARIELSNKNNKPTNLARFCFRGFAGADVSVEIGDGMEFLRTIELSNCMFSVSRNEPLELARLEKLSLRRVQLLSELFSCKLHSLEELKLDQCSGIKEFRLSSRSMKRFKIHDMRTYPFKATIDAPSIVSFKYEGILPQSISFAGRTTSSDELWKSNIYLEASTYNRQPLYGLLKALSQSEISMTLDHIIGSVSEEATHELPVAVEHLTIKRLGGKVQFNAITFLNMLFHMICPSFLYMDMSTDSNYESFHKIALLLFMEKERTQSCFWQRVLEGVGLQVKYPNQSEWQPVPYTRLSFRELSNKCAMRDLQLCVHLKWRD